MGKTDFNNILSQSPASRVSCMKLADNPMEVTQGSASISISISFRGDINSNDDFYAVQLIVN